MTADHQQYQHTRAEARFALLRALYEGRHGYLSEATLCAEAGFRAGDYTRTQMLRDVQHLEGRGLVATSTRQDGAGLRARITPQGVDVCEHAAPCPAGIARPDGGPSLWHRQLREARWRILQALAVGMPYATSEATVARAINDIDLSLSVPQLRQELCYLANLGLVALRQEEPWTACLTPDGTDVVEHEADAPAGVHRPSKYY